jgi:hypothetical protein
MFEFLFFLSLLFISLVLFKEGRCVIFSSITTTTATTITAAAAASVLSEACHMATLINDNCWPFQ